MDANEKTRLVATDPEQRIDKTSNDGPRFKKGIIFVVGAVLSVGMLASVAVTTSQGKTASAPVADSSIAMTENENSAKLKASGKQSRTSSSKCQLPEDKLNEIRNMQASINEIIDYVRNGSGKGLTWKKLANFVDTFGPRVSGSQSLESSIDFMIDSLAKDGLENVHGEDAMVPNWVRGNESATMIEPRVQKLSMLGLGGSIATPPEGITSEVIVVKSFQELANKAAQEVEGKIVVFNQDYRGYSKSVEYRRKGAVEAAKKGAAATLIRSVTGYSIGVPHTGWQDYDQNVEKIPTACISVEDADMLDRMVNQQGKTVVINLKMEAKSLADVKSRNVIAEIKGSKYPDQVVIVSGHIDSWDVSQGAQDDAGGVFISTEALSVIHSLGLRPKRTLRAVLWTAEEPGTHGAIQYAIDHKTETPNWSFIMESDIGTFKPNGIVYSGRNEESRCIMREILKFLKPIRADRLTFSEASGPDIEQWTKTGIPGGILDSNNQKYFNYHHTIADTMTHVDSYELDLCTILWAAVSFAVADLEDMLAR